ncbi:hypothetical protein ACQ4PT_070330 [Festuca glaucescens]
MDGDSTMLLLGLTASALAGGGTKATVAAPTGKLVLALGPADGEVGLGLGRGGARRCEDKKTIERSTTFLETDDTADSRIPLVYCNHKGKKALFLSKPHSSISPMPSDLLAWSAPPVGWIEVNTDASFIGSDKSGGAGAVGRDSNGGVSIAACSPMARCHDAEEAEAKEALLGIKLLQNLGFDKVILELDCVAVARALRSEEVDRSL